MRESIKRAPKQRRPRNNFSSRISQRTITQDELDSLIPLLEQLSDLARFILTNGPVSPNNPSLRAFLEVYPFFRLETTREHKPYFMIDMSQFLQFMGRAPSFDGVKLSWNENLCSVDLSNTIMVQKTRLTGDFFGSRIKPRVSLKDPHSFKRGIVVDENFRAAPNQKTFAETASGMRADSACSIMRFFPREPMQQTPALALFRLSLNRHTEKLHEIGNVPDQPHGIHP